MNVLLTNIKELVQVRDIPVTKLRGSEMKELPSLKNAWLLIENDTILNYGTMVASPTGSFDKVIDCNGKIVLPSWCDSHTHIVFAGNREQEFVDRINGLSYQAIAEKGGGILNSAGKLQEISEDELYKQSAKRLEEVMKLGTGAIEIKSGYGLTTEAELKMLRVAKRLDKAYPVTVKTTFLGAHAVPQKYTDNKDGYIQLICDEMIPAVTKEQLADYVDVFCEEGYFTVEDTDKILTAAKNFGLIPKIHVNQFNSIGGVAIGVKHQALTVDHLEIVSDDDIRELQHSETMPVALPACSFFLSIPYTPGRTLIDAGLPLAIATDYNPGSSPTGNMNFVVAAACIKMNLTPEEAINAATINAAYAMGLSETHGSISKGKRANLIITREIPSYGFIPYSFGNNCIDSVICNGVVL